MKVYNKITQTLNMDIQQKIADLFIAKDTQNVPKDSNSQLELKKIEHQLNIHLKNKQGLKYKKVSVVQDKTYDEQKFAQVIDAELRNKTENKSWKGLPMFMKWKLIEEYLSKNNITDAIYITELKRKLGKNTLDVKYKDKEIQEISI